MEDMTINENTFVRTAPVYNPGAPRRGLTDPIMNPQTVTLCEKLGIDDPLQVVIARSGRVMKAAYVDDAVITAPSPVESPPKTPIMSKLSLPAPMTPQENDSDGLSQTDSILSPRTPGLSDNSFSTTMECHTPMSEGKKTFKRRNLAMYTPDAEESVSTSSSLLEASPPANKLCKDNLV